MRQGGAISWRLTFSNEKGMGKGDSVGVNKEREQQLVYIMSKSINQWKKILFSVTETIFLVPSSKVIAK